MKTSKPDKETHEVSVSFGVASEHSVTMRGEGNLVAEATVFRAEFLMALTLLAKACDDLHAKGYRRPILVGGAAVEFHTGGAVVSGDFDFVTAYQQEFEDALIVYGFVREHRQGWLQRGLYHPDFGLGVEVVSGQLFDGSSDYGKIQLVQMDKDGAAIPVASIEDMIADRLGQYASKSGGYADMLDQAVKLFTLADQLDEEYLDERIRKETTGELGLEFLKANLV